MIHFQWTGSNTNPNNNAGQGRQGSDRHNAVILRGPVYAENGQAPTNPPTLGHFGRSYPARVDGAWTFLGFDSADLKSLARAQVVGATWSGELSEVRLRRLDPVAFILILSSSFVWCTFVAR